MVIVLQLLLMLVMLAVMVIVVLVRLVRLVLHIPAIVAHHKLMFDFINYVMYLRLSIIWIAVDHIRI